MTGRSHVEPLQRIGLVAGAQFVEPVGSVGKLRLEFNRDFYADFVATAANGRSDGGKQIRWLGTELHLHLADGLCDDALQSATPASVDSGDRAFFDVGQKNRNAVGGLDG